VQDVSALGGRFLADGFDDRIELRVFHARHLLP
jgi:hypothetical protein